MSIELRIFYISYKSCIFLICCELIVSEINLQFTLIWAVCKITINLDFSIKVILIEFNCGFNKSKNLSFFRIYSINSNHIINLIQSQYLIIYLLYNRNYRIETCSIFWCLNNWVLNLSKDNVSYPQGHKTSKHCP